MIRARHSRPPSPVSPRGQLYSRGIACTLSPRSIYWSPTSGRTRCCRFPEHAVCACRRTCGRAAATIRISCKSTCGRKRVNETFPTTARAFLSFSRCTANSSTDVPFLGREFTSSWSTINSVNGILENWLLDRLESTMDRTDDFVIAQIRNLIKLGFFMSQLVIFLKNGSGGLFEEQLRDIMSVVSRWETRLKTELKWWK